MAPSSSAERALVLAVLTAWLSVVANGWTPPERGTAFRTHGRSTSEARRSRGRRLRPVPSGPVGSLSRRTELRSGLDDDDDDDDDDDYIDENENEQDWRDFRARLVMQSRGVATVDDSESTSTSLPAGGSDATASPTDTSWVYESGDVIECGSIVISKPVQDFSYGGFRQQYFHKCVVLIVSHDDTFTKGIILNRPTDFRLPILTESSSSSNFFDVQAELNKTYDDDDDDDGRVPIWYGGDVQGFGWKWEDRDWTCLHRLGDVPKAVKLSENVLQDIYCTSLTCAKALVQEGLADKNDFHFFAGYAGWTPNQLQGELERDGWYMVAMDSRTVFRDVINQNAKPLDSGIDIWDWIMKRIGKTDPFAERPEQIFIDNMAKEWSRTHTSNSSAITVSDSNGAALNKPKSFVDAVLSPVLPKQPLFRQGDILCATNAPNQRPPFWPDQPIFHKSLTLILSKEPAYTLGLIINRPSSTKVSLKTSNARMAVRHGGEFTIKMADQKPLVWLHYDEPDLVEAKVGEPVDESNPDGIWTCSALDVETAIKMDLATFNDFLVVDGVSIWKTDAPDPLKNLENEIQNGYLAVIKPTKSNLVETWDILKKQSRLIDSESSDKDISDETLSGSLELGSLAWQAALHAVTNDGVTSTKHESRTIQGSDLTIEELSEEALGKWVRAFLFAKL